jgi:hypothetical protein
MLLKYPSKKTWWKVLLPITKDLFFDKLKLTGNNILILFRVKNFHQYNLQKILFQTHLISIAFPTFLRQLKRVETIISNTSSNTH